MPSTSILFIFGLLSFLSSVVAQTWTSCNPLNSTCPTDTALGRNYTFDFTQSSSASVWNQTAGSTVYNADGAQFIVNQRGDAPTIQSEFYIFFGVVEVHMKAATGQGIISSIVLESDDLDEVDWEFMGGNTTHGETNYFGKGNTTSYDRAIYYPVDNPQETFHNYTTRWTAEKIEWFIDGNLVRTLLYEDANGGKNFPQTPMNVRIGIWAAGDYANANGTIEWAGGLTDYKNGPYTMTVQSVRVTDFSSGSEYAYGDRTGSWQSIQITNGTSTVAKTLSEPPALNASQRWAALSRTTKIAVLSTFGAVLLLIFAGLTFCCIKQRRAGRREREIEDAKFNKETAELMAYRAPMGHSRYGERF